MKSIETKAPDTKTDTKAVEWTTYRTRFLVKAKQLGSSLSFVDELGRHHSGHKGDYLVESSDGVLRIAPRQIFEDVYVAMSRPAEDLQINLDGPPRARRKLPQPVHDRRLPNHHWGIH